MPFTRARHPDRFAGKIEPPPLLHLAGEQRPPGVEGRIFCQHHKINVAVHFAPAGGQRHHAHWIQTVVDQVFVIHRLVGLVQQRQDQLTQRGFRCRNGRQQLVGHHHAARATGHVFQRHQVLVAGEIRQRIGDKERLDVAHKGVGSGGHAANVGVNAGDQKLIAAGLFQHLLQRRAVKRAVAPLHQHGVRFVRGQLFDDALLLRRAGQARPPHVVQQGAVFIALLFRLRGVVHGNVVFFAVRAQSGDVRHHLLHHVAIFAPEIQEVLLHIMDQQRGAFRLKRPVHLVGRQFGGGWQRVSG